MILPCKEMSIHIYSAIPHNYTKKSWSPTKFKIFINLSRYKKQSSTIPKDKGTRKTKTTVFKG